jgi:hypothetical protein
VVLISPRCVFACGNTLKKTEGKEKESLGQQGLGQAPEAVGLENLLQQQGLLEEELGEFLAPGRQQTDARALRSCQSIWTEARKMWGPQARMTLPKRACPWS